MKVITSKNRQNFFTIVTIVGLLIAFSFYFFIYVPNQEDDLKRENFRVLTKITNNIEDRVNDYKQYINDRARISVLYSSFFIEGNEDKKGSIFQNRYTTTLSRFFLQGRPEFELIYFCPSSEQPDQVLVKEKLEHQPKPYLLFVRDTCSNDGVRYEYGFTLSPESIQHLLQEQAFENFFLRHDDELILGPNSGLLADSKDSLLQSLNGIKTGRLFSQEISGSTKKIFAQPFHLGTGDNFVLCGLMDNDEYHKVTRNLSGNTILIILLALFLLALSLPFVKFLVMSRNERLNISDALLAGITVILGTSVVVLILLDTYTYFVPEMETNKKQLVELSDEVSTNFENEISAACMQLRIYDSLIGKDSSGIFMQNIHSLRDSAIIEKNQFENDNTQKTTAIPKNSLRPGLYDNFTQVFWTDSAGAQLFKWSTGSATTPLIQVSERTYFKNILQNKIWSLPGKDTNGFYLEGINSWTTGENMAVIAIKSDHRVIINEPYSENQKDTFQTRMLAMTTVLNSVMNPILPMSSGFCIVDNGGNVIFHSDKNKNLSENFLAECSARKKIQSAMYSRTPGFFSTLYHGGDYKMYIQPINKLPFYLVSFQDNLFPVTNNTEVLSLSVILVLFFFLFICIQVIILHLITKKESLLKAKVFSFAWLWPLKEKQRAYQHILVFLVPSFFLLLFFLQSAGPVETLLIFFSSSVISLALLYLKIDQFKDNQIRKSRKEFMSMENKLILSTSFLILIVLNFLSSYFIDHVIRFIAFQIILCGFASLILITNIPILKTFTFRKSYLVIQLGLLMLLSIIPTFAFFRISFEKEAEIRIRHVQLELASELNRKSDELNISYHIGDSLQNNIYTKSFYKTRFLPSKFPDVAQRTNFISTEENVFSNISVDLTPSYNDIVTKEHNLANPPNDGSWNWKKKYPHSILFFYNDLQRSTASGVDSLIIQSEIPSYKLPLPFGVHGFGVRGTLFWFGILCCIIALYFFIRFFVRIIFTTDFFQDNHYSKLGIVSLTGFFKTTNVFLVGSPHSGKTNWLKKQFSENKVQVHINLNKLKTIDDVNAQLVKCDEAEIIIIDHFEYGFRDFAVTRRRLRLFEGLKQLENKRVLIVSNIHPSMFLREYPKQPEKQIESGEEKGMSSQHKMVDECDRWTKILGGYHKIYFPASGVVESEKQSNEDILDRECNNSYFLNAQKEVIRESLRMEHHDRPLSDEEIILRIESLAHVYYNSIWSALSEEEQYILYDIAQDGLVNLKNREVLTMLLNKGIMVYDNRFRLMNESFRNFVLSEVSADDALTLERNVKETGYWNYFKTPVLLILITIALFIFITQQETFNNIIAFITTFAAGIPIVFRLLGMVTSMKGTKVNAT